LIKYFIVTRYKEQEKKQGTRGKEKKSGIELVPCFLILVPSLVIFAAYE
jgi:hypothetical protein